MSSKTSHIPRDPAIAVSSYTAAVRRAEEDAERRAKAAFEQWKSVDLVQMKMEEAKTARDLVNKLLVFAVQLIMALPVNHWFLF